MASRQNFVFAGQSLLAAACALTLAACHRHSVVGGGGTNPGTTPTGDPAEILDADGNANALRVDLPGRMRVLVKVVDNAGGPVADLTIDNFTLYEDGQLVSPTESQQQLLPRPRVFRSYSHLLLDLSGSVASTPAGKAAEIAAARRFIEEVTLQEENYVAISWFFGGVNIEPALLDDLSELGFTNDREALIEAVENVDLIQVTSTSTNLYGAIIQGCDELDLAGFDDETSNVEFKSLTLVTFTDGTDQAGVHTQAEAVARLTNGTNSYTAQAIGVGTEIDPATLAAIGPNGWLLADNLDSLDTVFQQVGTNVRNLANSFYLVGYISPKVHSTVQRTLTVEAHNNGHSATRDYPFVPQYFSGGSGFLEVREPAAADGIAAWTDIEALAGDASLMLGRATNLSDASQALVLRRLNSAQGFDSGFAQSTGEARFEAIDGRDFLTPLRVISHSSGKIFVLAAGRDHALDADPAVHVLRLTAAGVLEDTWTVPALVTEAEYARDLVEGRDGSLYLLSAIGDAPFARTVLRRFAPDTFVLDDTFDQDGVRMISVDPNQHYDDARALLADNDGGVYVTGSAFNGASGASDLFVAHVTAAGLLDENFGTQGVAFNRGNFANTGAGAGYALRMDSQGRLVVAGEMVPLPGHFNPVQTFPRAAFWRFLPDGSADTSFIGNASNPSFQTRAVHMGSSLTANSNVLFGQPSRATAVRILPDDSLLAIGWRENARGDYDVCSWRLLANGLFDLGYNFTGFLIEDGSVAQGCDVTFPPMCAS
ncbi:MAG: hypothetical protein R3F17_00205 [Planctomycetota bacterium]